MRTTNIKHTLQAAFTAIASERGYQESLTRNDVTDQRPLESLSLIQHIINEAHAHFYNNTGQVPMDYFRKIAGIAVRTMQQYGCPQRAGHELTFISANSLIHAARAENLQDQVKQLRDTLEKQTALLKDRDASIDEKNAEIAKLTTFVTELKATVDKLRARHSEPPFRIWY